MSKKIQIPTLGRMIFLNNKNNLLKNSWITGKLCCTFALNQKYYPKHEVMKKVFFFGAFMLFGIGTYGQGMTAVDMQVAGSPIIANLDSLTYLLHQNGFMKNAQYLGQPELDFSENGDLPNYNGKLIQERMNALGSEVPLEYNRHVKGFIDLYGIRKKELTSRIMGLSDYYFPIFEEIMDRNQLPLELKYLAVVESALNPKATSWAGASGLWQFIYSTGVRYGLTINSYVDERRDVYKSTEAACQYFKDSYALYGDWLLVIASYNCGPGNVNKAIRRSGGKKTFWEIQQYLPKETRGYVPAFIAVAYLMNYASEHGLQAADADFYKVVESVEVNALMSFEQLSAALKISTESLYDLNPHYTKEMVPDLREGMTLYLPYAQAMMYASLRDSIQNMPLYDREGKAYKLDISTEKLRHKIRRGETLVSIARKYGVSTSDIKEWNIIRGSRVHPGRYLTIHIDKKERVYLDSPAAPGAPVMAQAKANPQSCEVFHQVKSGDTLYSIANLYHGTSVELLRKLNKLGPNDLLVPGMVIKVQDGTT